VLGAAGGIREPFLLFASLVAMAAAAVVMMPAPPRRRAFHADRGALRLPGFWLASAGIMGYLIGPLAAGAVARSVGFVASGIVAAAAGLGVAAMMVLVPTEAESDADPPRDRGCRLP